MIKLVCLHLDGVVFENVLCEILRRMSEYYSGQYTIDLENGVFGKSQKNATDFLIKYFNLSCSNEDVLSTYYQIRNSVEIERPVVLQKNIQQVLSFFQSKSYKIISYGGASFEYFQNNIGELDRFFDGFGYIQTKDFRPGLYEITKDFYRMNFSEVVFIDESANIGVEAKKLGIPFIGFPPKDSMSFQKLEMQRQRITTVINTLQEITPSFWSEFLFRL